MAMFKLGQRVKLARPVFPRNLGKTGRIREFIEPEVYDGMVFDVLVDWDDGTRDGKQSEGYNGYATMTTQLEPIIDPGCTDGDFKTVEELIEHCNEILIPAGIAE